jgi:hypothetical protein
MQTETTKFKCDACDKEAVLDSSKEGRVPDGWVEVSIWRSLLVGEEYEHHDFCCEECMKKFFKGD